MRLEPEAVRVLAVLDAQIAAGELGAEHAGDLVGHALVLEGLAKALAYREFRAVLDVEILARGVV